jgi:hypothetical protein
LRLVIWQYFFQIKTDGCGDKRKHMGAAGAAFRPETPAPTEMEHVAGRHSPNTLYHARWPAQRQAAPAPAASRQIIAPFPCSLCSISSVEIVGIFACVLLIHFGFYFLPASLFSAPLQWSAHIPTGILLFPLSERPHSFRLSYAVSFTL